MIYVVVDFYSGEGGGGDVLAAFRSEAAANKYAEGKSNSEVFEVELEDE